MQRSRSQVAAQRARRSSRQVLAAAMLLAPALLAGCSGSDEAKLKTRCVGDAGPNVNWAGCQLRGVDLSGANLQGAFLSNVDLSGANLTGANLSKANIATTLFEDAILFEANLTGTTISGGTIQKGKFCKTIMPTGKIASGDC